MKIVYDPETDRMQLHFVRRPGDVTTATFCDDLAVNVDADGEVVGIEITNASHYMATSPEKREVRVRNPLLRKVKEAV